MTTQIIAVKETRTGLNRENLAQSFCTDTVAHGFHVMHVMASGQITNQLHHIVKKSTLHVFCDFIHINNLRNRATRTTLFCALLDDTAIFGVLVILLN